MLQHGWGGSWGLWCHTYPVVSRLLMLKHKLGQRSWQPYRFSNYVNSVFFSQFFSVLVFSNVLLPSPLQYLSMIHTKTWIKYVKFNLNSKQTLAATTTTGIHTYSFATTHCGSIYKSLTTSSVKCKKWQTSIFVYIFDENVAPC